MCVCVVQTRLSNGTFVFKQLTDPLAVQADTTRLQVTTTTLPEGAMYIARVSHPLWSAPYLAPSMCIHLD